MLLRFLMKKKADEITIFDIDATSKNTPINYELLAKIARESKMPICYGGGVKDVETAERLLSIGIEKISLSSAAIINPDLIMKISNKIGKQSVVITLDVKKSGYGIYEIYTNNGTKKMNISLNDYLNKINYNYVGEVCVNSIDRDGTETGYDLDLIHSTYNTIKSHVTYIGGCNNVEEVINIYNNYSPIGLGASSFVVLKGKFKAVLLSYPTIELSSYYDIL